MTLTDRITRAVAKPRTDDEFDAHAEFAEVLDGIGMSPSDTGGQVRFLGADPVAPSTLRLGGAAAITLAAKSAAIARLWRLRGGEGQDIEADLRSAPHRLCPFYDRKWELLNGYPGAGQSNQALGFRFYPTADERWMMPLNPYPKIRAGAQRLLGVPEDSEAVAAAIAGWDARELEEAGAEAGVVMPMLRTAEEILDEPQYRDHFATMPLVEVERIGDAEPQPLPEGAEQPLSGVRALGMGHVIAGAGAGRALALHGADVLNLWRPGEFEHEGAYISANVGVRSATVDPRAHRQQVTRLLAGADVFYANRRPGHLAEIGLSPAEAAELRPGIVHATTTLNGEHGPWADRVGFDQTAGSLVGMMHLEGDGTRPRLSPILVVNDYVVSWLLTAGIVAALTRRATEGGSWRVHVSLTRAALWILSLGVFDQAYATEVAGRGEQHGYLDPETFTADTPLGHYLGVTDQVRMTATPGRYRHVLSPRGADRLEWL
ncbi:carnitine dehydratase [Saccharopolyspora rhizosphaerae]|uniref:Carnitine dehydratase n=1 Tax=Saccharopolyspora rhizosphaerae TaxID=2492662 RepID=A0A426K4U8_9PSEU|nr:CoA transferase [Saccharopolyspora rhizosphaerae]RRO20431.1 carnitine dehydratase [Saccharopolyspora rhizosphaerae]